MALSTLWLPKLPAVFVLGRGDAHTLVRVGWGTGKVSQNEGVRKGDGGIPCKVWLEGV